MNPFLHLNENGEEYEKDFVGLEKTGSNAPANAGNGIPVFCRANDPAWDMTEAERLEHMKKDSDLSVKTRAALDRYLDAEQVRVSQEANPISSETHLPSLIPAAKIEAQRAECSPDNKFNAYDEAEQIRKNLGVNYFAKKVIVFYRICHIIADDELLETLIISNLKRKYGFVPGKAVILEILHFLKLPPTFFDEPPIIEKEFIAFMNGTLNVISGKWCTATPYRFLMHAIKANYHPHLAGECPNMNEFVFNSTMGNTILAKRLWQSLAMIICNLYVKKFVVYVGVGDSGKSVLLKLIENFFFPSSTFSLMFNELAAEFKVSNLNCMKICLCPDLPKQPLKNVAVGVIKNITGGDTMTAAGKYVKQEKLLLGGLRLICGSNFPIRLTEPDPAMENRILYVAFPNAVPKELQDPNLIDKLISEREAIVATALTYLPELVNNNFTFAGEEETSQLLIAMYGEQFSKTASEALNNFIESNICFDDPESFVSSDKLFAAFSQRFPGVISNSSALSKKLGEEFEKRGIMTAVSYRSKTGKRERGYMGISLV